ncbi:hypothetical protein A2U01_0064262, partial [Trifolium medium]|nr:hypothetical protein [Trifolium medium]
LVQDKMIEDRGFEGIELMKEIVYRCNRKRLTLISHYEEEEKKRIEEENRIREEEEKNRIEEVEKMRQEDHLLQLSVNIAPEAKGKEIEAEPHSLVLVLQEKLEAQGAEQEKIK